MTLLRKMDRFVYASGIDRIIFRNIQPRTLRWTPLLVLGALAGGFVLMARAGNRPRELVVGSVIFYGAFLLAMLFRMFGPRLMSTADDPLDERELMVKARATASSGMVFAAVAMLFCFYMSVADILSLWRPRAPIEWIALGFGLQAANLLLPTLMASWMQPRPLGDDED